MRNEAPRFETLLTDAASRLRAAGVADPQRDARWLLREAAGLSAAGLAAALPSRAPDQAIARFRAMIARREAREPVSHILGRREFFGRSFRIDRRALDPRPESEALVAAALAALAPERRGRALDLGVGSGCLLLSVLAERPCIRGLGVDASEAALALAAENAAALALSARLELRRGDWLEGISGRFDVILCNPPYIGQAEWAALEPEPRLHEPMAALCPGADELAVYRRLAPDLAERLTPEGAAFFEVGRGQAAAVTALFEAAGLETRTGRDLGGAERMIEARRRRHGSGR